MKSIKRRALSLILSALLLITGVGCLFGVSAEGGSADANIVYLNGSSVAAGTGTLVSPFNSFKAAVAKLKEANKDGTIVVTGPTKGIDTTDWDIGGTLTITSVDPTTSKDYRNENCTGAYLGNSNGGTPMSLGGSSNTIVLEHLDYATKGGAGIINFMDHNLVLKDVTNWRTTDEENWTVFKSNHWNFGFNKNSSKGKTVVTIDTEKGNIALGTPSAVDGDTSTAGIDLTVNKFVNGGNTIVLGNRGNGTLTVNGDMFITLNMPDTKIGLNGGNIAMADTGKISIICNNGAQRVFQGFGLTNDKYILTCEKGATATHGETADEFVIKRDGGTDFTHAMVRDISGSLVKVVAFDESGTARFNAESAGEYVVTYVSAIAQGAQKTAAQEGKYSIRFTGSISGLEFMEGVGVEITSEKGVSATTQNVKKLAKKLLAKEDNGSVSEIKAEDFEADALTSIVVDGIDETAADTFNARVFFIISGETYYGPVSHLDVGK
ncbi:MAG: hypothetical protein ACI3XQ_04775 [Eubacteriales bacterium]